MKLAYADPPYIGQAKRHYKNDPSGIPAEEVNYMELIRKLLSEYDGWALSASSPSIPEISRILGGASGWADHTYRIGAWVKPFCSWKPTHRVQYTWEPVFFVPVRDKGSRSVPSVRDYVSCRITTKKGTHGAKPPEFNDWILNILGYQTGDTLDDLFPGTGGMSEAVQRFEKVQP
ncbi:MAG: hypothetical protein PHX61_02585 [Alphaproteobacteria bacterium]|nr:hypothetical protein [Alphaproteobacteria bacterium]